MMILFPLVLVVGQVREEVGDLGEQREHTGVRGDHLLRPLVPCVRVLLVGDRDHDHRLLHRRLRLDHEDRHQNQEVENGKYI